MEYISRADTRHIFMKQSMLTTMKEMETTQKEACGSVSNDPSSYTCGNVGHPTCTCLNKEKVLAAWRGNKSTNDKKSSDPKEKEKEDRQRGFHGGYKKGGNGSGAGGNQQSLCLTQQVPGEIHASTEPKLNELSDDSNYDSSDQLSL